jgi:hypothetical protein
MSKHNFKIQIRPERWLTVTQTNFPLDACMSCIEEYCGALKEENFTTLAEIYNHISFLIDTRIEADDYSELQQALIKYLAYHVAKLQVGLVMETADSKYEMLVYISTEGEHGVIYFVERIVRKMWTDEAGYSECIIPIVKIEQTN